jgi:hypothetical protein
MYLFGTSTARPANASSPTATYVAIGPDGADGATFQKILEERRAHSTLFFHYEKSFQDHLAGRRAKRWSDATTARWASQAAES